MFYDRKYEEQINKIRSEKDSVVTDNNKLKERLKQLEETIKQKELEPKRKDSIHSENKDQEER